MLIPPPAFDGWKVTTIGDDIAWIKPGNDGRLYAINPEAGYFGVAPGTNEQDQSELHGDRSTHDVIFTNVALTDDGDVWWEGMTDDAAGAPDRLAGPATGRRRSRSETGAKAAHPNARFTVAATNNPALDPAWDDPKGVPIDAFIFGGRRSTTVPLVTEARDWTEGVYMAATMGSETTAAAAGAAGRGSPRPVRDAAVLRLQHGRLLPALARPRREAADARARRCPRSSASTGSARAPTASSSGRATARTCACCGGSSSASKAGPRARSNAFGISPRYDDLDWYGLDFTPAQFALVISVDGDAWAGELALHDELFGQLAHRLPSELPEVRRRVAARLAG